MSRPFGHKQVCTFRIGSTAHPLHWPVSTSGHDATAQYLCNICHISPMCKLCFCRKNSTSHEWSQNNLQVTVSKSMHRLGSTTTNRKKYFHPLSTLGRNQSNAYGHPVVALFDGAFESCARFVSVSDSSITLHTVERGTVQSENKSKLHIVRPQLVSNAEKLQMF
jgi:hypothetical protein